MSQFVTVDDLKAAILDLAARRRYRIMYGPHGWDEGSEVGHDEAREAVRPDDVATVAAILWSHDGCPAFFEQVESNRRYLEDWPPSAESFSSSSSVVGVQQPPEEVAYIQSLACGDPLPPKCGHTPDSCGCKQDRILWNVRGEDIDEIVIHDPEMVHIEQMNDRCWGIGIYVGGGERWSGHFSADSKGHMTFTEQDDDIVWALDESHEEAGA